MRSLLPVCLCLALLALAAGLGCRPTSPTTESAEPAPPGHPWFKDVTEEVGLQFTHDAGPVGDYFMPQQVGSGAALFDFDGDGRLDVYLLQNGGPKGPTSQLFQQTKDGHFHNVSVGSGLDIAGHNMGVAIGDVNNDGRPDVLVTQYGGVKLFLNKGDGTFQDVTEASGLVNPAWGTSAAFFDYDRDGWLDLVVVNYVDYDPTSPCKWRTGRQDFCAPRNFRGRVSRLFHNVSWKTGTGQDGKEVRFEDVSASSHLGRVPGPGLGVVCADFDGDGWVDVFVANDGEPNRLWINQKNGTFKEDAVLRGVAYNGVGQAQAGMGIALGDVDGDGLLDLFVTHLGEEANTLWKQGPRGLYQDQTARARLMSPLWRGTGFGTVLADFNHDGALDLAVANGRVAAGPRMDERALGPFWSAYGERNQLFANDGQGRFQDVSPFNAAFCGHYNVARGLVRGDVDGDGAQDLLITTIAGPARLFRNVATERGHWLTVQAFDPKLRRDAIGSEVRIRAGGRERVSWLHPSESNLCSSEPTAHFGLGSSERIDAITIVWPDGSRETFKGPKWVAVDRAIQLNKGEGCCLSPKREQP
jgi:hypothetical protein